MRGAVDRVGGIAGGGEGGGESGGGGRAAYLHRLRGQIRLEGPYARNVADPGADRPHVPPGAHRWHADHDHGASLCGSVSAHRAAVRCPCAVRSLSTAIRRPCTSSLCRRRSTAQNRWTSARRHRPGGRSMQIRVLGPVEILVDGHTRPLRAAGERELLALLALSAGRVVPVPALIDAL